MTVRRFKVPVKAPKQEWKLDGGLFSDKVQGCKLLQFYSTVMFIIGLLWFIGHI